MQRLTFQAVEDAVAELMETTYAYVDANTVHMYGLEFRALVRECVALFNADPALFEHYRESRLASMEDNIANVNPSSLRAYLLLTERRTKLWIIFEAIDALR